MKIKTGMTHKKTSPFRPVTLLAPNKALASTFALVVHSLHYNILQF